MADNSAPRPKRPRKTLAADAGSATTVRRRKITAEPAPPPVPAARPLMVALGVGLVILLIDQFTKFIVVQHLRLAEVQSIDVIEPWLNLRMAWNEGVNFGLLSSGQDAVRWALIGVALAICVGVMIWLWRVRPGRLAQIASGLLIGGAVGNVIDRMAYGAVADFLNMSLPGWRNPYSFNVADIAIFLGAVGLVLQPGPARSDDPPRGDKTRDGRVKTR